ncbi:diacylglycerol kinase (plasmid) [Pseudorhodobacter turbinis]|uniref:Diacylglycerol kinase n=1 Tax=Pseudorhodobacter turbinis TaxID=2500533 RepID=A0A4P8EL66_9RHOB|nr:diacylglycerol kinase [Pseudorhodobacter turbinis]QCO57806.1 diacylglycerol kinase [Pseudorhodobacter turbinis]
MTASFPPKPQRPTPRAGLLHILDAAKYSRDGALRLWQETAARLECGTAVLAAVLFLFLGASLRQWLILTALYLALLMVEALNTAIEVLTNVVSPHWSIEAKHAKDLGSLAVGLMLAIIAGYVAAVLLRL